jgi:hypothetical protein
MPLTWRSLCQCTVPENVDVQQGSSTHMNLSRKFDPTMLSVSRDSLLSKAFDIGYSPPPLLVVQQSPPFIPAIDDGTSRCAYSSIFNLRLTQSALVNLSKLLPSNFAFTSLREVQTFFWLLIQDTYCHSSSCPTLCLEPL